VSDLRLPEQLLDADAPCPQGLCDGSGFVIDEASRLASECACRPLRVSRRRAKVLRRAVPKRYRGVGFDRPPISSMPEPVVRPVRQYVRRLDDMLAQGRGLWLFGNPGTGKTTLAMLVSSAAIDAGYSVAIYSMPRLLAEIRETYDDDSPQGYVEFLDRLAAVDLLHIDDLGAENPSPWVLEQLYAIINARYEEERALLITTNIEDPVKVAEQIGQRTVSRMEEMCTLLPLFGQDARQSWFAA
jgi:DNA replication protein DnaC